MGRESEPMSAYVDIDGVRLETLDWGGAGPPVVFLAGYANTPHFLDAVARSFTDRFRVLGLVRRAHGESGQPEDGYDIASLGDDIVRFFDAVGLKRASLVGHSFARDEMCYVAGTYPDQVTRLVFLDALYDMTDEDMKLFAGNPLLPVDPPPETFESVSAYCENFVARYPTYRRLRSARWSALWARARERTPSGRFRERIRPGTAQKLFEGRRAFRPDYSAIRCPVLAIFAFQDEDWSLPEDADGDLRMAMKEYIERFNFRFKRRCIERVRSEMAGVRIVEFENTSHYCFLDREADVLREMRRFL